MKNRLTAFFNLKGKNLNKIKRMFMNYPFPPQKLNDLMNLSL